MLLDAVHASGRLLYHLLGAESVETHAGDALVRGYALGADEGRPVVLVHGLGDTVATWHTILAELAARRPVLALDLPPFGRSRLDGRDHLVAREHADVVAQAVREHGDPPVLAVGHSLGGWVVQWLAHDHPHLVDRVAMLAPGGARLPGSLEAVDVLTPATPNETRAYLDTLWYEPPLAIELFVREALDRLHSPPLRAFLAASTRATTLGLDDLAAIDAPGTVVWGHQDTLLDPGTPAWLDEGWGGVLEHTYLARSAHMVHQDRPRATLKRLLDLAGVDP